MTHNKGLRTSFDGPAFHLRLVDLCLIGIALYLNLKLQEQVVTHSYIMLFFAVVTTYLYTAESIQLYRSWRESSLFQNIAWVAFCLCVSFCLVLIFAYALKITSDFSRLVTSGWGVSSLFLLGGWRIAARSIKNNLHKRGYNTRRVAIAGSTEMALRLINEINSRPDLGLIVEGVYDDRCPKRTEPSLQPLYKGAFSQCIEDAKRAQFDKLYIALPMAADERITHIIRGLGDTTVDTYQLTDYVLNNLMHARLSHVGSIETISVFESPYYGARDWIKRSFDIVVSVIAILLLALPMLIIALLIKLTSKGPVLFKQDRYGLDARPIKVFKFRSMTVMDNGDTVRQATKGDARITPLGAFLRRTSLDELPQFFNVLLGDMSVVGPRPHAVAHNEQYRKLVDFYMLRHKVKPGITGWAQINGWRGETDSLEKMEKRVEYDLAYIKNWSLFWDAKIVFLTFFRGFTGKNVY